MIMCTVCRKYIQIQDTNILTRRVDGLITGHSRLADTYTLRAAPNCHAAVSAGLAVARVCLCHILLYGPAQVQPLDPSTRHLLHQL